MPQPACAPVVKWDNSIASETGLWEVYVGELE